MLAIRRRKHWQELIIESKKIETSKYYTPSLEEFYIGFECEFFNRMQENEWIKEMCDADTLSIALDSYEHGTIEWGDDFTQTFRVKYLDREDIESLGFKYCKESDLATIYSYKDYFIAYYNSGHISITEMGEMCRRDTILFNGRIKNKSELKRILKMIGVIE